MNTLIDDYNKLKVELDLELVDKLTVLGLKEASRHMKSNIDKIAALQENGVELASYQIQDNAYDVRLYNALKVVLKYYGEQV
jgi:hypothetical protein